MKRYLFLKLGLTILVFAAASPRSQVSENYSGIRESRRISNNNQNSQNVEQTTVLSSQRGDTNTPAPDYQGVMGKPGVDFPVLKFIPRTKFTCRGKKSGYYADLETNCQVFHICDEGRKVSFLCPNGTIFQQSDLICDWWFKVDCASSPTLYDESAEQLNEENRRRKENRKVQHQAPQQQQQRQQHNQEKIDNRQRKYQQNNYAKKDVNQYTSNHNQQQQQQNYYDSNDDYSSYKETQIPSESASFVSNRYNQQRYLKNFNLNDVADSARTYIPPSTLISTSTSTLTSTTTEKIINSNRGARTFNNYNNNNKFQYRNQVNDQIKTTTQHTIYSPTVPPFTSTSRLTTKSPAAFSTNIKPRQKSIQGFYITKDYSTLPTISNEYTTVNPTTISTSTTTQTPLIVNRRPLVGSDIITRTKENLQLAEDETTTIQNTNPPSVPSPFKSPIKDKDTSTHKFNEFTYLPKSTEMNNKIPTPKPTQPTEYTTYPTEPTVTDNIQNMIKTLEEIEGENPLLEAEKSNSRPGLNIPPSAGPKTLHSLAIYFATALDNLVSNDTSSNTTEKVSTSTDETHVTLLSRMTQDKYNSLFDENQETTTEPINHEPTSNDISLKNLVQTDSQLNDLDSEQSRGPVSSSTPRIRQLAQVFTQALSAYLDDPDTFKKVLEEIRPTEPPQLPQREQNTDGETTTEFKSYTKEEDEVLDFSDADKSSTYKPFIDNNIRTTTQATIESRNKIPKIPTPNPLALDLNNGLKISTASGVLQDLEDASVEENTESDDYFPFSTGEDDEDSRKKATAKPYGADVKPANSTPISIPTNPPIDELLPPFKVSLNQNDEYLQSAHSQSFVSHNLIKERQGKSLVVDSTITTTEYGETTTSFDSDSYTSTTTTTPDETTTNKYDDYTTTSASASTTQEYSTTTEYSTTEEPTTISKAVPNDHWSTSPEVTKLWESTLYVDPQIINRNLEESTRYVDPEITTYRPEFSTQPYRTTTEYFDDYTTTTDTPSTTTTTTTTTIDNEYYSTIIDLGIHSLLNTSELEIAHSQAQQIFGQLNSTEQDLLIEKMKEAESNSTVRRLILLLVSTCDASLSNNKTVQETRNSILHALLNVPSNEISTNNNTKVKSRSGKQLIINVEEPVTVTVTTITPTTQFQTEETTTAITQTTSKPELYKIRSNIETPSKIVDVDVHQDTRALELLRSLYSLAAKWGKK